MKVLHVLSTNRFSGAENVVCQIISMTKHIDNITMTYCSCEGSIRKELENRGIDHALMPELSVRNLKEIIVQEKPDLLHAHDMKASLVSSLACGNIPLICHIHNNDPRVHHLSIKSLAFLPAAIKAKRIFWVSEAAKNSYIFNKSIQTKSTVLRNIVDPETIQKKAAENPAENSYDVVYIGRLQYPKNPQRFVDVINRIAESYPNIKAAMVGAGDESPKASSYVQMLGFKSNPYPILKNAKVLLMTSDWEGLPMVALEAMILGVPVVSTPVEGMQEIIENGKNGFLCESDEELAEKVLSLITDSETRKRMSEEQLRKSAIFNNVKTYRDILLDAYDS